MFFVGQPSHLECIALMSKNEGITAVVSGYSNFSEIGLPWDRVKRTFFGNLSKGKYG